MSAGDKSHTAITSWSGFVYQGKVAIYHVIKLLDENLDANKKLTLQLDSLEDFAILNDKNSVVSLHQVKALKTTNLGGYKKALAQVVEKGNVENCRNIYFHFARKLTDVTSDFISLNYFPINIYTYDNVIYCSVDEIDLKIEDKLKQLFLKLFPSDKSKTNDDYVTKARCYLDQLVLKQILKIHRIVHENIQSDRAAAYTQVIPFSDFFEIINKDLNQENLGEDYYLYILFNDFFRYYQEYCIKNDALSENELIKLSAYMKNVGELSTNQMICFFRNIMPHREFKFTRLSDYKDGNFNRDNIHDAFLAALHKLREANFDSKLFFIWIENGKTYVPTIINESNSKKSDICYNIIKNALTEDLAVMFESSNLITTDINADSITLEAPDYIRAPEFNDTERNRINRWKAVSLISIDQACKEIK